MDINSLARNMRAWLTAQDPRMMRLMLLFAAVYVAEGLGQFGGLINLPVRLYFIDQGWTATEIATMWFWAGIPWLIKPLWGMISDWFPIFGYRRKFYLLIANVVAMAGYAWMTGLTDPTMIAVALTLTAFGLAFVSTLCGALLVIFGKSTGMTSKMVSMQWIFFFLAGIVASKVAGMLCEHLGVVTALHICAALAAVALAVLLVICWFYVDEEKVTEPLSWASIWASLCSFGRAFLQPQLWFAICFIFLYYFSPGLGTPLTKYMREVLHFSDGFLGDLGAYAGIGGLGGGFLFLVLSRWLNLKWMLTLSIVLGAITQLGTFLLVSENSAIALNVIGGVVGMLTVIGGMSLAAEYCPDGSEGFTYAILMCVHNAVNPLSELAGGYLYDSYLVGDMLEKIHKLIWISAGFTAASLLLVPLLKITIKPK